MKNYALILISLCLLLGCAPKHSEEPAKSVLTESQKKTLDDAKKVEGVLEAADEKRRKEAEGETGEK